jgi:hypothetical protein
MNIAPCNGAHCLPASRERLDFLADNPLYTKRFAYYVGRRCRSAAGTPVSFSSSRARSLSKSQCSSRRGEGINRNHRINPMQNKLPMHLSWRCGARTRSGSRCRSAAMPNGRCRMHGGMSPGAPKGNKNAFKHGHYTAEAIASRREIAKLLRDARALVKQVS